MSAETSEVLKGIISALDQIAEDTSIPRNIRRGIREAKEQLFNNSVPLDLRISSAMSILDELANDPNIPLHGRTLIWNILTQLETIATQTR